MKTIHGYAKKIQLYIYIYLFSSIVENSIIADYKLHWNKIIHLIY